jgi:type II secretion system protein N
VDRSANAIADVHWRDVDLGRVPELDLLIDADWQGEFGGELHVESGESLQALKGGGQLELRSAALVQGTAQGFKVPDLHFASGESQLEIKAGRVEIAGLKLSGTEADVELRGQIYLRAPASDSVVNGTLSVRPIPGAGTGIDQLLTAMNRNQRPPGGTFTYALYGTVSRIRVR